MAEPIGRIVRIQIQRTGLRRRGGYDPGPLLAVPRAALSARGVVGETPSGWALDVHHADHPDVRGRGLRPLSMGFTSHYSAMAERFGDVPLGEGGENLIVATDRRWTLDDLAGGVVVRSAAGEDVVFDGVRPAEPCLEFTSHLLGLAECATRDEVLAELDFLAGGTRGFLLDGRLRGPHVVAVGDEVLRLP